MSRSTNEAAEADKVALLFCAYNEEQSLPAKIENLRRLKASFPDIEIRAYADCCTDATVPMLRAASDVVILHEGVTRLGKAAGMRLLVNATQADILIFTDANVLLDVESVPQLIEYFADPSIGTVAGTLHYTNPNDGQTAWTGSLYWRLEESIKRLESATGSTMGADGSIFATRRSLYPTVPPNLLDDMIVSISPLFAGYRVVSAPDVHAFERAVTETREELQRKRRIACRAFATHRYLAPRLRQMGPTNRFKYFSHKFLRWFSGAFLIGAFILATAGIGTLLGPSIAALGAFTSVLLLVCGRMLRLPIVGTLVEIMLSMFAVAIGVVESLAGRDYQTWNPAKSRQ